MQNFGLLMVLALLYLVSATMVACASEPTATATPIITPVAASGHPKMYWVESDDLLGDATGKIQRANLDGSKAEDIISDLERPEGIALDLSQGKVYWTDKGNWIYKGNWLDTSTGKIQRANLDGSEVEDLVSGLEKPDAIALDPSAGKIYWVESGTGKIQRANLDGSEVEDLVSGLATPLGIALDLSAGKIYWTDEGTVPLYTGGSIDGPGKIQRANLDGSEVEDLVSSLETPGSIALDLSASKVYWTDVGNIGDVHSKIQRANLDGSEMEDIRYSTSVPRGIALDLSSGKIYWTEVPGKIKRANLDGSGVEDLVSGLEFPSRIALGQAKQG